MLTLYTVCFIVGGTFVALAAFAGIDGPDFDLEFDTDLELTAPREEEPETWNWSRKRPRKQSGLPLTSLKFWTFGSCFFGLTGILLSLLQPALSRGAIAAIALAVGVGCGTAIAIALQRLSENQANSLIRSNDLIGLVGTVEIPFDRNSKGKIRINVKDTSLDLVALTESSQTFKKGEQVYIVGIENSKVWVVEKESLSNYE
jgi:membrane protein implicated in regulation of membrane protease activity